MRGFYWYRNPRPWMTLNGHYALFQNTCAFGAHRENLNEDRPILSAAKIYVFAAGRLVWVSDPSFWQHKVYADICGGGASNDNGVVGNGNFQYFRSLFFRSFSGKANIIVQQAYYSVPHRIYADSRIRERSFYVKFCFVLSSLVQNLLFSLYRNRHYIYSRHKYLVKVTLQVTCISRKLLNILRLGIFNSYGLWFA